MKTNKSKIAHYLKNRLAQIEELSKSTNKIEFATGLKNAAILAVARNPRLAQCTPKSIFLGVLEAARLGVDLDVQGSAYLVPYGEEARLIIGYRGLVELATRGGNVKRVEAVVVYEGDEFDLSRGTAPSIMHKPNTAGKPGKPIGAYALATWADGSDFSFEYMTWADVEVVRGSSRASKGGPWDKYPAEMAKKTVIRRLCKSLPLNMHVGRAIAAEDSAEAGTLTPVAFEIDDGVEVVEAPQAIEVLVEQEVAKAVEAAPKKKPGRPKKEPVGEKAIDVADAIPF